MQSYRHDTSDHVWQEIVGARNRCLRCRRCKENASFGIGSVLIMTILIKNMKCTGDISTWPASPSCGYWKHSISTCPALMRVVCPVAGSVNEAIVVDWRSKTFGGYWTTGGTLNVCTDTDTYVWYSDERQVYIDVWKAYIDGIWSSSVALTVSHSSGYATGSGSVAVGAGGRAYGSIYPIGSPADASTVKLRQAGTTSCTAGTRNYTLTVYDDGTFTLT
jgi:hypothetical protein